MARSKISSNFYSITRRGGLLLVRFWKLIGPIIHNSLKVGLHFTRVWLQKSRVIRHLIRLIQGQQQCVMETIAKVEVADDEGEFKKYK